MKVLVFPHHLELGGSQVNAIDLAASLRDIYGHQVVIFATPGPALELVNARGMRFIAAPRPKAHPSPTVMWALRRAVRDERVDLVHAWDWPQCLDAFYGIYLGGGVPLVGSNMSMEVTRFLPRSIPLTYGTPALVEAARRARRGPVVLLEPPVDTERNSMAAVDPTQFRQRHGLDDGRPTLVIVSRLVAWMKLEGILRSMEAVALLGQERAVRLVVVGGGTAYDRLNARAAELNRLVGSRVVVLTGPMTDPRPAYAAADIVLGMGSSILRGMAFAKPCLVLGEENFSEPLNPETSPRFLNGGFFGLGDRSATPHLLYTQLKELLGNDNRLRQLGAFSRRIVEERFSLPVGARTLDELYRQTVGYSVSRSDVVLDGVRSGLLRIASGAIPKRPRRHIVNGGLRG